MPPYENDHLDYFMAKFKGFMMKGKKELNFLTLNDFLILKEKEIRR